MELTISILEKGDKMIIDRKVDKEDMKNATLSELHALISIFAYFDLRAKDVSNNVTRDELFVPMIENSANVLCRYIQSGGKNEIAKELMPDVFEEQEKELLISLLGLTRKKEDKDENNN